MNNIERERMRIKKNLKAHSLFFIHNFPMLILFFFLPQRLSDLRVVFFIKVLPIVLATSDPILFPLRC